MGLIPLYSSIVIAHYSRYLLHLRLPYGARPFHDVLPAILLWSTLFGVQFDSEHNFIYDMLSVSHFLFDHV